MQRKDKSSSKKLSMDDITNDKSRGKVASHLRLKAGIAEDNDYFNDKFYTKKQLQKLCEAYEITVSSKTSKLSMNEQLISVIQNCDFMLTPSVFSATENLNVENIDEINVATVDTVTDIDPNPQKVSQKRKGKGKQPAKKSTKNKKRKTATTTRTDKKRNDFCSICNGIYDDSSDWVQCDRCDRWVHGSYVGILSPEQWE